MYKLILVSLFMPVIKCDVSLSEMPIRWDKGGPNNENNNEDCMIMLPGVNMANCSCTFALSCYKPNNFKTPECGAAPGYELDNRTKSCYKFHTDAQTWVRAFMICAAEGAHLAVIDSPGEEKVLQDLASKFPNSMFRGADNDEFIILGFSDWQNHNLWMTVNGKYIDDLVNDGITSWAEKEPNNEANIEYCGSMSKEGKLNDVPCAKYTHAFFVNLKINKNNYYK